MSKILDQLAYSDELGQLSVAGEQIRVHAHQIILWVSISTRDALGLAPGAPKIPAILDTGNTFGFSIAEEQLLRWCGMRAQSLETLGPILINAQRLNRHSADVWLHPNQPKKRDAFRSDLPFRLELRDGIAIYPADRPVPCPTAPAPGSAGHRREWTPLHNQRQETGSLGKYRLMIQVILDAQEGRRILRFALFFLLRLIQ